MTDQCSEIGIILPILNIAEAAAFGIALPVLLFGVLPVVVKFALWFCVIRRSSK